MDRKNNPSSMFFVVVVYTFHIDPSFKAFVSNVVLRATNMSRALLECECLYCAMKLMVFSFKVTNMSFLRAREKKKTVSTKFKSR